MENVAFLSGYIVQESVAYLDLSSDIKGVKFTLKSYKKTKTKDGKQTFINMECCCFGAAYDWFERNKGFLVGKKVLCYAYVNSVYNGVKYDVVFSVYTILPYLTNLEKQTNEANLGIKEKEIKDTFSNNEEVPF